MGLFRKLIVVFFLATIILATEAATQYSPGKRAQLPVSFNHSYFGMGAGYTDIPFSNHDLTNGIQATSFTNPEVGLNVFIGHFFNPYVAGEISLMRPIQWAYANNNAFPHGRASIWISVFGITLRPTLPLTQRFSLYGIAGFGIISRHGFSMNHTNAIASTDLMTVLTGGGMTYAFTPYWHVTVGLNYAVARPKKQQPHILYAYVGFYYLFHTLHLPEHYTTHYIFHKNLIQVGAFSTNMFNPNVNKYFTIHYIPIFWGGDLKIKNGEWLMYERNIFHTHKIFSFDVGVSASTYHSSINNTAFQAFSVFPAIRLWFLRSPSADFYFTYAIAGPSYITHSAMDGIDLGGHFTFQDLLGVGAFLGHKKHFNIDMKIAHYSNGNLLPNNPGVQVPLVISLGYAF